ncbi:MAG: galactokinase [Candidatus Azotimanducaceae bacterium]|jgi:galactokinase
MMINDIKQAFLNHFKLEPSILTSAPGRVNLIGEHTDYNEGLVLPCAIDYKTLVAIRPRNDSLVKVIALDWQSDTDEFDLSKPIEFQAKKMWSNYVRGVANEWMKAGFELSGCDIAITGNVPQGAGLSSSAALEVACVKGFSALQKVTLSSLEIAKIAQSAENNFVGCACGIMDQLISTAGVKNKAVLIDCQDFKLTPTEIPDSLEILIVNSNVQRGLVDSEYNLRREQCEVVSHHLSVPSLRSLTLRQLDAINGEVDKVAIKRARHVIEENLRVSAMHDALTANNIPKISQLMAESHQSMRNLFEITVPEIDLLVQLVADVVGSKGGVRMTGGGFGGCIVALVPENLIEAIRLSIGNNYEQKTGLTATIYQTKAAEGAALLN